MSALSVSGLFRPLSLPGYRKLLRAFSEQELNEKYEEVLQKKKSLKTCTCPYKINSNIQKINKEPETITESLRNTPA